MSTTNGPVKFNPEKTEIDFPNKPLLIKEIRVDGVLTNSIANLMSDFNILQINLITSYFGDHRNILIEYRVNNESDWVKANSNEITIIRNKPGECKLEYRIRTGLGEDDYKVYSQNIYIKPYFYETIYFILLMLLVVGILIVTVYFLVQHREKKKRIVLNEIIQIRTADLEDALVELKLTESNLRDTVKLKDHTLKVLAHDIRSPLYTMQFIVKVIQEQ